MLFACLHFSTPFICIIWKGVSAQTRYKMSWIAHLQCYKMSTFSRKITAKYSTIWTWIWWVNTQWNRYGNKILFMLVKQLNRSLKSLFTAIIWESKLINTSTHLPKQWIELTFLLLNCALGGLVLWSVKLIMTIKPNLQKPRVNFLCLCRNAWLGKCRSVKKLWVHFTDYVVQPHAWKYSQND